MELITSIFRGGIGIVAMLGVCYLLSSNRKAIDWKLVGSGVLLQIVLAILILKIPFVYQIFKIIADGFVNLLGFTEEGARFVFGAWPDDAWVATNIPMNNNGNMTEPASSIEGHQFHKIGFMFAFKVLPTVVFFAAFSSALYYLGILQAIIYVFAKGMSKVMRLSGAESLAAAANVFIGQTEAPLVVKPYLDKMSKSEIMCLMTGGMATIAGGVFALFVSLLGDEYALHFLTASIISAPAAIVAAKMLYPETNKEIDTTIKIPKEKLGNNLLDAISIGTQDGIKLAVNVGAMLLVFIALIAFVNAILGWFGEWTHLNDLVQNITNGRFTTFNLESILGLLFAPIAWLLGVPSQDLMLVGALLGKKTAINEVVGYVDMSIMMSNPATTLSPKSVVIATYALCGFSNFASIGIQIGGISAICPNQRQTLTELGIKALIGGTIACFLTAAVAGMILSEIG